MIPTNTNLTQALNSLNLASLPQAIILLIAGLIIAKLVSATLAKALSKLGLVKQPRIIRRVSFYIIFIVFLLAALQAIGFKLNILLGAAGILTIAIGFASQISISNMISGLILFIEKPFKVGDTIQTDGLHGTVLAIDLLATKIRTDSNTLVRIPNETLIKSNITNTTHFAIRRFTVQLHVAYQEDFEKLKTLLLRIAKENSLCLSDPAPSVAINSFSDNYVAIDFFVWGKKEDLSKMQNDLLWAIHRSLITEKISLPLAARMIVTSEAK